MPALIVLALGIAGTFQLSRVVQRARDSELETNAIGVASLLAQLVEMRINEHELAALRRWAESPPGSSSVARQRDADLFLADHPSFAAVERIDSTGRATEAAGAAEARQALAGVAATSPTPTAESVGIVASLQLPDDREARGVPIVLRAGGAQQATVVALLEPEVALRGLLGDGSAGYSVRVLSGNEELFRVWADGTEPPADRYWRAANVALSIGAPWTVTVHPTAMLAVGTRLRTAIVSLVGGLTLSALLALLVYVVQVVRARGVSLVRADADLNESIDETEREVTEVRELRGALETRVTERTAILQDTIEELETFNYSVAHDLRSPMGAVINFAGIFQHDYGATLDDQAKDYLRRISASATGAVSLMNGLLAFSQSGREDLRKRDVDMLDLVEGVRDDLHNAKPDDSSSIEIGKLPDAFADPSMMRRVFTNLISNARKFAAPGTSAQVEVGGYVEAGENVYFVRDHGVGFDMRYAQKLFGVFERLHSSEEFEGHGVGLAIVSRLVRRHGGRIWAQGAVGKGATFYFSLPTHGSTDVGS